MNLYLIFFLASLIKNEKNANPEKEFEKELWHSTYVDKITEEEEVDKITEEEEKEDTDNTEKKETLEDNQITWHSADVYNKITEEEEKEDTDNTEKKETREDNQITWPSADVYKITEEEAKEYIAKFEEQEKEEVFSRRNYCKENTIKEIEPEEITEEEAKGYKKEEGFFRVGNDWKQDHISAPISKEIEFIKNKVEYDSVIKYIFCYLFVKIQKYNSVIKDKYSNLCDNIDNWFREQIKEAEEELEELDNIVLYILVVEIPEYWTGEVEKFFSFVRDSAVFNTVLYTYRKTPELVRQMSPIDEESIRCNNSSINFDIGLMIQKKEIDFVLKGKEIPEEKDDKMSPMDEESIESLMETSLYNKKIEVSNISNTRLEYIIQIQDQADLYYDEQDPSTSVILEDINSNMKRIHKELEAENIKKNNTKNPKNNYHRSDAMLQTILDTEDDIIKSTNENSRRKNQEDPCPGIDVERTIEKTRKVSSMDAEKTIEKSCVNITKNPKNNFKDLENAIEDRPKEQNMKNHVFFYILCVLACTGLIVSYIIYYQNNNEKLEYSNTEKEFCTI